MRPHHLRPLLAAAAVLHLLLPGGVLGQAAAAVDSADAHYRAGRSLLERDEPAIHLPGGLLPPVTVWEDLKGLFGRDYLSRAQEEFRRALRLDSTHAGAAAGLAELAVGSGEAEALREADRALAGAAAHAGAPPEVWLWRARVGAALRSPDAPGHAERFARAGGDAGLAALAEARAWFALGSDSAGAAAYARGLEVPGPGALAYFADLGPVARVEERIEWDHVPRAQRGPWLTAFWGRRAAEAGVEPAERIAEHYRRLEVASTRYRRTGKRDAAMIAAEPTVQDSLLMLGWAMGVDDRGTVYLLHGEPSRRVGSVACAPNESWQYRLPDGPALLFHFRGASGQQLVLTGDPAAGCEVIEDAIAVYEDREGLDPRMGMMAARLRELSLLSDLARARSGRDADLRLARLDMEGRARSASLLALRRDSYRPDLGRPLEFYYDTYAFRGTGGATRIVFALAAPGDQLPAERLTGSGARYAVDVTVLVFDSVSGEVFRVDSARTFAAPVALRAAENLRTSLELSVQPGRGYAHRVTLRAGGGTERAGGVYGGPMEVLDFRGDTLAISDLVLAEVDGRGWRRGEVELGLVPPRQFRPGDVVTLYYELYSPPADELLATRIHVEPLGRSGLLGWLGRLVRPGSGTVTLDFSDMVRPSDDGAAAVLRTVDLRGLSPGVYRLRVEVESEGRRVSRSREFLIQEP